MRISKFYFLASLFLLFVSVSLANAENYALQFNGNDEVVIPHHSSLSFPNTSNHTIELWFKYTGSRSVYHILGKRVGTSHSAMNYQIARDGNGLLHTNSCYDVVSAGVNPPQNQWLHMAVTYDGAILRLYLNGEIKVTTPFTYGCENTTTLQIGASGSYYGKFIGFIDEVRIWNVTRTEEEIANSYNRIIPPNTPGLVGYWNFDEELDDQNVYDGSSLANNGTLGASLSVGADDPTRVLSDAPLLTLDHDASVVEISAPADVVEFESTIAPQAVIENLGLQTETIPVTFQIGFNYNENTTITLAPGESGVVTFPEWHTDDLGSIPIQVSTALPGDVVPFNDKLQKIIAVTATTTAPVITKVSPDAGGNTGTVTVTIEGDNFQEGAEVKLTRSGESDILSNPVTVENPTTMTAVLDLTGALPGSWDIVVINPDSEVGIFQSGFTIDSGGQPDVWVDILGRPIIRTGRQYTYTILYGNRGNVDAGGVPIWIAGIPAEATVTPGFELTSLLPEDEEEPISVDEVPFHLEIEGEIIIPLIVPIIPPNHTGSLNISINIPQGVGSFSIKSWSDPPFFNGSLLNNPDFTKCIAELAKKFLPPGVECGAGFGEAIGNLLADIFVDKKPRDIGSYIREVADVLKACAGEVLNKFQLIKIAIEIIKAITSGIDIGEACGNSIPPPSGPQLPVTPVGSLDPNDKVGFQGSGNGQFLTGEKPVAYTVFFENIVTATAPAQEVVITDQLEIEKLDLSTFSFGEVVFGDNNIVPPSGLYEYATEVDLRPDNKLIVKIEAKLDIFSGLITWRLTSIDPDTGEPPEDPLAGFLPPNVNPPEGEGHVLFIVEPKENLETGTEIKNMATIVFDVNPPIETPEWLNTIDNTKPTSQVLPLASTQTSTDFEVYWLGTDEGAGIRDYTIFVSEEGGPYAEWLSNIPETSATFTGENGKTYAFYSVARDHTGNTEDAPESPDTATTVVTNQPPVAQCQDVNVPTDSGECTATTASIDAGSYDPDGDPITLEQTPAGPYPLGATEVTLTVSDDKGLSDSCAATVTVLDQEPPVINNLAANPNVLWPPSHHMVTVAVTAESSDNCDAAPTCRIVEVTSNEPENGLGDGDTAPDWETTGNLTVNLRAERSGTGSGRIYTIAVECTDQAGNSAQASATVTIPHDMN